MIVMVFVCGVIVHVNMWCVGACDALMHVMCWCMWCVGACDVLVHVVCWCMVCVMCWCMWCVGACDVLVHVMCWCMWCVGAWYVWCVGACDVLVHVMCWCTWCDYPYYTVNTLSQFCLVCHDRENESLLLLCDDCDRGTHTYCCKVSLPPTIVISTVADLLYHINKSQAIPQKSPHYPHIIVV